MTTQGDAATLLASKNNEASSLQQRQRLHLLLLGKKQVASPLHSRGLVKIQSHYEDSAMASWDFGLPVFPLPRGRENFHHGKKVGASGERNHNCSSSHEPCIVACRSGCIEVSINKHRISLTSRGIKGLRTYNLNIASWDLAKRKKALTRFAILCQVFLYCKISIVPIPRAFS
ncbi:unnamed protein product [Urochloa humidicola]